VLYARRTAAAELIAPLPRGSAPPEEEAVDLWEMLR
jgi:hypothetical protein